MRTSGSLADILVVPRKTAFAAIPTSNSKLTEAERAGICVAVQSAFLKLKNLYAKIVPIFDSYGFRPPSPGVIARDLSEKIETSIVQHCDSFTKGAKHTDLCRFGADWEVKIDLQGVRDDDQSVKAD